MSGITKVTCPDLDKKGYKTMAKKNRSITPVVATSTALVHAATVASAAVNDSGMDLVKLALGGINSIEVKFDADATREQVEQTLSTLCSGFNRLKQAVGIVQLPIGKLLFHIQQHKLYSQGEEPQKDFTEYLNRVVKQKYGISRSTAMDMIRCYEAFPSFGPVEYEMYGNTRILEAARAGITEATVIDRPKGNEVIKQTGIDLLNEARKDYLATEARKFFQTVSTTALEGPTSTGDQSSNGQEQNTTSASEEASSSSTIGRTIKLSAETWGRLDTLKERTKMSFDVVVKALLDSWDTHHAKKDRSGAEAQANGKKAAA